MKTVDEMFAEGLVAKLQLEPGKRYILVMSREAVSDDTLNFVMDHLRLSEIGGLIVTVSGKAKDAIVGLEIENVDKL